MPGPDARLERPPGPRGGGAARHPAGADPDHGRAGRATRGSTGSRAAAARSSAPRSGSTRRSRSSSTCAPREFVAPNEVEFVPRWLERLRSRGGLLAEAGYLIRPYPDTAQRWVGRRARRAAGARLAARSASRRTTTPHGGNYFDSIYHAAAVVGINTTAQIESAIVGRPVHTVLADEFRDDAGGNAALPLPGGGRVRAPARRADLRRARGAAGGVAARRGRRRAERAVPAALRPAARARPPGDAAARRRDRGARRHGPRPHRSARRRTRRSSAGSPRGSPARRRARRAARMRERRPPTSCGARSSGSRGSAAPSLAGPWPGDEIGELLYWIPFLRWAQTANIGLRERLYVPHAPEHEAWYAGIGAGTEAPDGALERLDPELVLAARPELARQDPACASSTVCSSSRRSPRRRRLRGPVRRRGLPRRPRRPAARWSIGAEDADPDDLLVARDLPRPAAVRTASRRRPDEAHAHCLGAADRARGVRRR